MRETEKNNPKKAANVDACLRFQDVSMESCWVGFFLTCHPVFDFN